MNPSREQLIENYKSLLKKRKDLTRKNRSLQTKIGQFLRKNKMDLTGTIPQLSELTAEEESQEI